MKKLILIFMLILPLVSSAQWNASKFILGEYVGASTAMDTTTMFQGLAVSSATAGWQSDSVKNTTGARDYIIYFSAQMKFGTPASDKAVYIDICPWYNAAGTLLATDQGTVTLPTGVHGTTTIASPNNLVRAATVNCAVSKLLIRKTFSVRQVLGYMPDGFSLIITNFSGLADSTINTLKYTTVN